MRGGMTSFLHPRRAHSPASLSAGLPRTMNKSQARSGWQSGRLPAPARRTLPRLVIGGFAEGDEQIAGSIRLAERQASSTPAAHTPPLRYRQVSEDDEQIAGSIRLAERLASSTPAAHTPPLRYRQVCRGL